MGPVYSHLSEEERQVIKIEIGNGTSIRRIAGLIGRHASTVSREVKRPMTRRTVPGSANGRPTASSARDATCMPRSRDAPVSSWRASCPTRPPTRASRPGSPCSPPCPRARGRASPTTTAPNSPVTGGCASNSAWPRISRRPVRLVPAREQREPQRRDLPPSAQTLPHRTVHGRRRAGHRGRDRQPSHAGARLPHTGRGLHRRTARISRQARALHF